VLKHHFMKMYGGIAALLHILKLRSRQASSCGCSASVGKTLSQPHMDMMVKKKCLCPCQGLNPSHPVHSHHYNTPSQLSVIIQSNTVIWNCVLTSLRSVCFCKIMKLKCVILKISILCNINQNCQTNSHQPYSVVI
jgi:hypothetical protein